MTTTKTKTMSHDEYLDAMETGKEVAYKQDYKGVIEYDADFGCSKLNGCIFRDCEFERGNFLHSSLEGATFIESYFKEVDFRWADLSGATIEQTFLSYSDFSECTSFRGARIERNTFHECNMGEASFVGAIIKKTNFNTTSLQFADFRGCTLIDVDFCDCDLKDADFRGCIIDCTEEQLRRMYECGADFEGAIIR